jgi:hypothetical protein
MMSMQMARRRAKGSSARSSRGTIWVLLVGAGVSVVAWAAIRPGRAAGVESDGVVEAVVERPLVDTTRSVAVTRFAAFATEPVAAGGAWEQGRTVEGIRRMADVLGEIIVRDLDASPELAARPAALRELADALEGGTSEVRRARVARAAFVSAANAMTSVQQRHYPHLDRAAFQVRWAARRVSARRPLASQGVAVQRFFDRASDALLAMAR